MKNEFIRELLMQRRDMAYHNLFCYSMDFLMTKAKEGYEKEWKEAKEELKEIEKEGLKK